MQLGNSYFRFHASEHIVGFCTLKGYNLKVNPQTTSWPLYPKVTWSMAYEHVHSVPRQMTSVT